MRADHRCRRSPRKALQLHDPTKEDEYRPQLSTKSEEAVQTIHENERVESIKVTLATRRDEGEHIRIVAIQTKAAERREAHKLQQEPETAQELAPSK